METWEENYNRRGIFLFESIHRCAWQVVRLLDTKIAVCSSTEQKTEEIIQDNENAFGFRGQTVFIISHNHSWLPFNAGLAVFMDRKLLESKQWKVLVLQVVGVVTTAHWCIVCFIAASWRTQKMHSLSLSPLCSIPVFDRQYHCVVIHWHTTLKGPICEHTHSLKWMASSVSCFHCSFSDYLALQVTQQTPVGILARLPMPAGRQETLKCVAKCASPVQWDIHCTARRRESASPTGPGRADSHSANVRGIFTMSLWCYVWHSKRGIPKASIYLFFEHVFPISNLIWKSF